MVKIAPDMPHRGVEAMQGNDARHVHATMPRASPALDIEGASEVGNVSKDDHAGHPSRRSTYRTPDATSYRRRILMTAHTSSAVMTSRPISTGKGR